MNKFLLTSLLGAALLNSSAFAMELLEPEIASAAQRAALLKADEFAESHAALENRRI